MTSNGTAWTSAAASGGQLKVELFTAPGTWTKPASCTFVTVRVVGGGGGGSAANTTTNGKSGGYGGYALAGSVPVSGPVAITVGTGGNGGSSPAGSGVSGGTSSFGSAVSCTGGGGATFPTIGTTGSATVSSGTALNISSIISSYDPFTLNDNKGASGQAAVSYSVPLGLSAGYGGRNGASPNGVGFGGVGGAIIVEYVG